jgi:hypothetical protein
MARSLAARLPRSGREKMLKKSSLTKLATRLASAGRVVVEHSPHHPKLEFEFNSHQWERKCGKSQVGQISEMFGHSW